MCNIQSLVAVNAADVHNLIWSPYVTDFWQLILLGIFSDLYFSHITQFSIFSWQFLLGEPLWHDSSQTHQCQFLIIWAGYKNFISFHFTWFWFNLISTYSLTSYLVQERALSGYHLPRQGNDHRQSDIRHRPLASFQGLLWIYTWWMKNQCVTLIWIIIQINQFVKMVLQVLCWSALISSTIMWIADLFHCGSIELLGVIHIWRNYRGGGGSEWLR